MAANRLCRDSEIALCGEVEERRLEFLLPRKRQSVERHPAVNAALPQKLHELSPGGMVFPLFAHGVEKPCFFCRATLSLPHKFVVDVIAKQIGVIAAGLAHFAGDRVAKRGVIRMEHVRHGGVRHALVLRYPAVFVARAESFAHVEEYGMREPAMPKRIVAARAKHVEPPRLEPRERFILPLSARTVMRGVVLFIRPAPPHSLARHAVPSNLIHAQKQLGAS